MSSLKKIVTLKLQRKRYPAERVEQHIIYRGTKVILNDSQTAELLAVIPELWNSEKDQLINFSLFEDKTYVCNRHKQVYNFSLKETEVKSYYFDSVTESQLDQFVSLLIDFYNKIKLQEVDNFYDSILEKVSDISYVKQYLLEIRNDFLSRSDYMFNSDYVFKSDETKQAWVEYRQQWRDITESEAWVNGDYLNITIPVSPEPEGQLCDLGGLFPVTFNPENVPRAEYERLMSYVKSTDYEDLIRNFTPVAVKLNILNSLAFLKLPIGFTMEDLNYTNNLIRTDMSVQELADELEISDVSQLDRIDAKLELIDENLKKYDINFTVSDIISGILDKMKKAEEEKALNDQADELIYDLLSEEGVIGEN